MIYILSLFFSVLIIITWLKPKWSFYILIALIPFHAFLITSFSHFLNLSDYQQQILTSWKEIIISVLAIKIVYHIIINKKFPFKILVVDKLIFWLFILTLLTIPFLTKNLTYGLLGLRYDFEMFLIFLIARSFQWSKKEIKNSVFIILGAGILISIFVFLQVWFLPKDFLRIFGYSVNQNWLPYKPLPAFQEIGDSGILRAQSFLAGPNQLGSYLQILFSIALSGFIFEKELKYKLLFALCSLLFALSLFYTYSRAAWIGASVIFMIWTFVWFYWLNGRFSFKLLMFYLIVIIIVILLFKAGFFSERFLDIYLKHQGSTLERFNRMHDSLAIMIQNPFGLGVGRAGMVANLYDLRYKGILVIPESWYFQIALELGILGLFIYLTIMWQIIKNLWQAMIKLAGKLGQPITIVTFLSFLGLSVHCFFLHTWSDISTTLTFWFLAGITFYLKEVKNVKS